MRVGSVDEGRVKQMALSGFWGRLKQIEVWLNEWEEVKIGGLNAKKM